MLPGLFLVISWAWKGACGGGGAQSAPVQISKSIDTLVMKLGMFLARH